MCVWRRVKIAAKGLHTGQRRDKESSGDKKGGRGIKTAEKKLTD